MTTRPSGLGNRATVSPTGRIAVVGGGLAGLRAVTSLRRKGHTGPLTLIGAESHLPYDRPPLSKDVLRGQRNDTTLPLDPGKLDLEVRTATSAVSLAVADRVLSVRCSEGVTELPFDGLVIATGSAPIRVPGEGEQLTLRTIDDALAVRARLRPDARVALIGASWIGAEVATVARAAGCRVTCVDVGEAPLAQALGIEVADYLLPWWDGIELRCGVGVVGVHARDSRSPGAVVELVHGGLIEADVVITGVGVRPKIDWLTGSGLAVDRGVLTDERLRAAPGVVAIGDVAQRYSKRYGEHLRVEHWDDAGAAGAPAADALLTGDDAEPYDPVPYFWSDQFGHKLQYVGRHRDQDTPSLEITDEGLGAVSWHDDEGRLSAWLGIDRPRELVSRRQQIATDAP